MDNFKNTSFWFDTLDENIQARAPLQAHIEVDVAIIGAGYTGLWTAYYLKKQQPDLSIAIVESQTSGFGASGRNCGWLMAGMAGEAKYLSGLPEDERQAGYNLLFGIIDEVAKVTDDENIQCDLNRGGAVYAAARYPEQIKNMQGTLKHFHEQGLSEEDYRWLDKDQLAEKVRMRNGYGGIFTPHCATINPAKLVRGLARCVENMGVTLYEKSPVISVENKQIHTDQGSIKANVIVPATEGFSDQLLNLKKYVLPVQSLIIATEPLSDAQWDEIGLHNRPAFSDGGRLTTYGQRSQDGRLLFGARGGYMFGGKVRHEFSLEDPAFELRQKLMVDLFPSLEAAKVTHGWGGTLGMARGFCPFAVFDPASGIASAGGFSGEGVGASNLFGRTLADMILQKDSQLTNMPWVFTPATHKQALKKWEPEPLRFITYKTILKCFGWEDDLYNNSHAAPWRKKLTTAVCNKLALLIE